MSLTYGAEGAGDDTTEGNEMLYTDRTNTETYRLALREVAAHRRDYGVTYESTATVKLHGGTNTAHPHRVTVWDNTVNPVFADGRYSDPEGYPTDNPVTVLVGAESIALTAHPQHVDPQLPGRLHTGDRVILAYPNGREVSYTLTVVAFGRDSYMTEGAEIHPADPGTSEIDRLTGRA